MTGTISHGVNHLETLAVVILRCSMATQRSDRVFVMVQIEFAKTFVTPIYDAVQSIAPEIGKKVLSQISRNVDLWGALGASGPPPLAVLRGSHSSAPKELHVHCGEAVCKDGTSQCGPVPVLFLPRCSKDVNPSDSSCISAGCS